MNLRSAKQNTSIRNSLLSNTTFFNKPSTCRFSKRKASCNIDYYYRPPHERKHSAMKKSSNRSKAKSKSKDKVSFNKTLLLEYEPKKSRKVRQIKYIPETIVFKQKNGFRNSGIFSKTQKIKSRKESDFLNKENVDSENQRKTGGGFIMNKDLLKASLKPSRVNFMNRVSNVYDLVISRVILPQFVEYFLGEALYVINKNKLEASGNTALSYDWKLDEFKKICQRIYENSQEEDLKHFMSLSLPTVCRWNSKASSAKNDQSISNNTLITAQADSRVSYALSKNSNEDRINYFKSLSKKERVYLGEEKQSIDVLDKLNSKLDNYIKNMKTHKISQDDERSGIFDRPLKEIDNKFIKSIPWSRQAIEYQQFF